MQESIILTKHFIKRFRERQANTKRIPEFAQSAYDSGKRLSEIEASALTDRLANNEAKYGSAVYVYKNFCYWFQDRIAITIWPLPTSFRGKI